MTYWVKEIGVPILVISTMLATLFGLAYLIVFLLCGTDGCRDEMIGFGQEVLGIWQDIKGGAER